MHTPAGGIDYAKWEEKRGLNAKNRKEKNVVSNQEHSGIHCSVLMLN